MCITYKLYWNDLGKIKELGNTSKHTIFTPDANKNGKDIVKVIPGIYVWLLPDEDQEKTVYYLGESKNIWKRLEQEIIDLLGGAWNAYQLPQSNFTNFVLNTYYDEKKGCPIKYNCYSGVGDKHYSPNRGKTSCISALLDNRRIEWAKNMLDVMEIAIATITTMTDDGVEKTINEATSLKEIEAAIIFYLRQNFKKSVNIEKIPNNIETALFGAISAYPKNKLIIEHKGDTNALPKAITEIISYIPQI